jgi:hypothetical protein
VRLSEEPIWGSMLLAFGCFTLPPMVGMVVAVLRQRNLDRLEAEAMAAEGYPPPDPPTTDSLSVDDV